MIQGRVTSLHISSRTVHVVEAEMNRGRIEVLNAFTVRNMQRFFTTQGKLINMASMIDTIVMALNTNGVVGKRLMITFDDVFQTSFSIEAVTGVKKPSSVKKGLTSLFRKDEEDEEEQAGNIATIKLRQKWGQYITQDDQGEAVSVTLAERDMVESMSALFETSGYHVISIEAPETTLVYTRNAIEYSYDYLHKIVIFANNEDKGEVYVMTKDVPSIIKTVQMDSFEGDFEDKIVDVCEQEAKTNQMRNPFVFLVGDAFNNVNRYISIAEKLEESGIQMFDLYGIANNADISPTAVQIKINQSVKDEIGELTCEYGMCISQLLRGYEKNPSSLCGKNRLPQVFNTKNKIIAVKVLRAAAIVFLVVNIALTALCGLETFSVHSQVQNVDHIRSELHAVEERRNTAKTQLMALSEMDNRLKTVFTFALDSISPSLNIASIDTIDMLGYSTQQRLAEAAEENANAEKKEEKEKTAENVEETQDPTTKNTKKAIIVRGYSTKSSGPVEFYNAMVAKMDDVQLVATQQMELPSGEIIYAFEIQVGGNAA